MNPTSTLLYLAIGSLALIVGIGAFLMLMRRSVPALEDLPMTPLQRRAWLGLLVGALTSVALAVLFWFRPILAFREDTATRLGAMAILAAGGIAWWVLARVTRRGSEPPLDERDREILLRAPSIQVLLMMLTIAAWMIFLTETYRESGSIPLVYPTLIFWSCFIANILGMALGVLFQYRVADNHAQG